MKKMVIVFLLLVVLFIASGCDPRKRMGSERAIEVYSRAKTMVLEEENWENNYLFTLNNYNNLAMLDNVKYVSKRNTVDYSPALLQTRKTAFKANAISLLENYKDEEGLNGWIGSGYEHVTLNISDDEIERVFQRQLDQFSLSLCSYDDGRLRVDIDYSENGVQESYIIYLFIAENNIYLDNYETVE